MIEIRKRVMLDGGPKEVYEWIYHGKGRTPRKLTLYVLVKDSKRIDSFLKYSNAIRARAALVQTQADAQSG